MVRFTKRYKYSKMNGGKKRRRKTIRKQRRRKKTKKQKRRRRRKTKRRMKGGSAVQGRGLLASPACSGFNCDLPQNAGAIFTKYSNNNNPFFPDPMSLNRNVKNPISQKPMASAKKGGKRRRRKGRKSMKGGFFWDDWGLGDGLLAYYKGTNAALNTKHLYAGNKPEPSATPSDQHALLKKPGYTKTTPNVPTFYEQGATKAAGYRVNN